MTAPILPLLVVFFPLFAGGAAFVIPSRADTFRERFSVLTLAVTFALSLWLLLGVQLEFTAIPLGFTDGYLVHLRTDELNRFMVMFASLFGLLSTIYSTGYMKGRPRLREYYPYVLLTVGAANGALLSDNWLGFIAFWGIVLVTLFLLTTIGAADGEPGKVMRAAGKSLLILGAADMALIVGVGILFTRAGTLTVSETSLAASGVIPVAAFVLIGAGALSKAGAMPLHSWLPDMAEAAPTSVTALLPASLDKLLGIYLLARIVLNVFEMTPGLNFLLMVIGAVTIVAAVVMAMVQHDLRKLLSFHAVSQVGYMVLGIGTGVPVGIAGGVFHMLNNAIYKTCLFLTAGSIEKQTGTTEISKLGGLARAMPITFGACAVAAFAISGVPPFNGFVSKWMVYSGLVELGARGFSAYWVFLVAALFGSALTLASFVKVLYSGFLGQRPSALSAVHESRWPMTVPMIVLAALCVVFGVWAKFPIDAFIGPIISGSVATSAGGALSIPVGFWNPGLATGLMILGILVGLLIFAVGKLTTRRIGHIFIGGTKPAASLDAMHVSGTGFYNTIRETKGLSGMFANAEERVFDVYEVGGRIGNVFVQGFRAMHNGVLSTYLAWSVIGLGAMVFALLSALLRHLVGGR